MIAVERLNKMRIARHFLEAPAPDLVDELLDEIERLNKVVDQILEERVPTRTPCGLPKLNPFAPFNPEYGDDTVEFYDDDTLPHEYCCPELAEQLRYRQELADAAEQLELADAAEQLELAE